MIACYSTINHLSEPEPKIQIEQKLSENQPTLFNLINNLPGMAYRCHNDLNWTMDFVSEGCDRLTGYKANEIIGNQRVSYAQIIHPNERNFVWNQIQIALQERRSFQLVYRIITANKEEKWVWEQGCGVFSDSGEILALEGLIIDITESKRAEEELALLQTIIQEISKADDFHSALLVALRKVCEATGWDFGEAWIPANNGTVLECSPVCYSSTPALAGFRERSLSLTFPPGVGLPGKTWLSQQSNWIPDVSLAEDSLFLRNQLAKEYGLKAGFAVPIVSSHHKEQPLANEINDRISKPIQGTHEVLAVLGFFMFESRQQDRRMVELVSAVAAQLGSIMKQKQAEAALRESERRLSTLIDSLPGIVFSCTNDPELSMIYISNGVLQLTGYRSEELIGNRAISYDSITHPEDLPKVREAIKQALVLQQPYVIEYRIKTKSGEEKWVWDKGNGVFDSNRELRGIEGFITDITESKRSQQALQQAEAKYRSIFENAIEGIFQTTPDGQYISANPALARIYGYSSPIELMAHLTDIQHQLYVEDNRREEFIRLLQENDAVSEFESQVYRQDGSQIWISENARAVRDERGTLLYYEGTVEDITERKLAKEQLFHHAFYDTLTGLPNRALFMDRLSQAVERTKRGKNYLFSVLFIDLDGFKLVNDNFGHLVGDQLLVAIARRLEKCLRVVDTVARLGGDEFTILLEDIDNCENATIVADRVHKELLAPFWLDGNKVFTAASIGIVYSGHKKQDCQAIDQNQEDNQKRSIYLLEQDTASSGYIYERPEDLLRDADRALYRAKTLGKARYEVF